MRGRREAGGKADEGRRTESFRSLYLSWREDERGEEDRGSFVRDKTLEGA